MKKVLQISLNLVFLLIIFENAGLSQVNGQDSLIAKNKWKGEIRLDIGNVLPTNTFVRTQNTDPDGLAHYNAWSARLVKQTMGDQIWQQIYGYPAYGAGIYSASFTDTKKLGNPIAVYGFFNAPFFKVNRWSVNYELGLGLTFNWNHLDPLENPYNVAISADESVYIDAGVSLKYQISKRMAINVGYGFTHFSNGRLKMPNKGLNTEASKICLSYSFDDNPTTYQSQVIPPFHDQWEWVLSAYGGARNVIYVGTGADMSTSVKGINFAVCGISNTINRQVSYKSKVGLGFTMEYNGSQNSRITVSGGTLDEVNLPFDRHLCLSIFPSYELVINNLSIVIQPGIYLYRIKSADMTPFIYQRIGVKYHISKNSFLGINLRAIKLSESDFIEWTIGHRLSW
ncbi:MAG: acyloxyacyl hydrolase [Mariniphaga sp.]